MRFLIIVALAGIIEVVIAWSRGVVEDEEEEEEGNDGQADDEIQ